MAPLLGVVLAAACSDEGGGSSPAHGDLGYATFRWECAGPGDIACLPEKVAGFPRTVALGSRFEASFVLDDDVPREVEAGWLELVGPKAEVVSSTEGSYDYAGAVGPSATFHASEAGPITVRAMAQDDSVADYVGLSLQPVTSLAVVRDCTVEACPTGDGSPVGPAFVGERVDMRVEPYGDGALLVGDLEYVWESLTPEVAAVSFDGGHLATLELLREGTAFVRVTGGGVEDTVAIMVVSEGPHRRRPGEDGSGSETDTDGTGSDTGPASDTGTGSGTDTGTDTDAGSGTTTGGMQ